MSLRQVSTCDFVSRLPTCQTQDFPIYTEFEDGDLSGVDIVLESEPYQTLRSASRYQRAYFLDQQLNLLSQHERVWLLQAGYFYDSNRTYGNASYLEAFEREITLALETADDATRPALYAVMTFAQIRAGQLDGARENLAAFRATPWPDGTIWSDYADRLEACIATDSDECLPEASFIER